MKTILTKTIFQIYDVLNGSHITKFAKECSIANEKIVPRDEEINAYLSKFKIKSSFDNLPITGRKYVIEHTQKVAIDKIKSWAFTGGSFGEPLRIPYSKYRNSIRTGTFKHFNELAGYSIGDSFALIRAKNKSSIIKYLRNETIIIPSNISEKNLNLILDVLQKRKVKVLMGYPTVMFEIAKYIDKNKISLPVKFLISTSEMLDQEKRNYVKKVFDCAFVDRYSNEEVGLIAQQKNFGGDYFVNRFGVYVELLDEHNHPVKTGETGRVVVSDFNNDLIPFLRYDTGDMAVAGDYHNSQLITIKKILGRTADIIFDVNGNPISSLALGPAIYKPLSNASLNTQFQLVQVTKDSYILKIKSKQDEVGKDVMSLIVDELRTKLGVHSNIDLEFVEDIPPLKSGKRPVYINLYKRKIV
ncbi:MAG: hypothetical protein LAT51_06105 [Flavobacteriaceae bacterium]|nr:hypothetical protein [Flavobacteriaceae bacterium]